MHKFLRAIGFSDITKKDLDILIEEIKESIEFSSEKKRSNTISNISRKNEIIPINLTPNLINLLEEEYDITEKTIDL